MNDWTVGTKNIDRPETPSPTVHHINLPLVKNLISEFGSTLAAVCALRDC